MARLRQRLKERKKEYEKSIESGLNPDLASQSLERAMYTWLWDIERYSGNKTSTFERYESIYRNYIQDTQLGRLIIFDIKKITYTEIL